MASLEATPVKLFDGKSLQFVSMNSRVIGWGEERGAYAYDRKLNAVTQGRRDYSSCASQASRAGRSPMTGRSWSARNCSTSVSRAPRP